MRTQFYDKAGDCQAFQYIDNSYKSDEYSDEPDDYSKLFFDVETITPEENTCHTDVGFTMFIYSRFAGIKQSVVDMLNAVSHDKDEMLLIAHN